jgi:2-hydroxy-6-oxonona-2,4-dienedioate hydrolase
MYRIISMNKPTGRLESIWTDEDGLRMHTRVSTDPVDPERTPIVCVHGLSVSSRYMVPTAVRLAPFRRVYAPDLPGFGLSDHPARILDIPELTDALIRRMDTFEITAAVLLGNSMGCQIIADLALRYPERIARAVLTGPTMDRCGRTMRTQAWRLMRNTLHEPLSSIVTQARDYRACGLRRTVGTLQYALADQIEKKLPRMHVPTLLVRGTLDTIAPQRWVEELAALLPHAQVVVIPDAPHAVNYDAPAPLARAVLSFLADEQPAAVSTRERAP